MIQSFLRRPGRRYVWLIIGYLCGYVALDWVSYLYPVAPPLAITPWNPPPGLSVALLLRTGLGNAPWLFVAAFAAELLVRGPHLPLPLLVVASVLPTLAYTLLAAMLRGPLRFNADFTSLRDGVILVATAAVVTGLLAVSFVGVLTIAAILPPASFARGVAQYWIGDLIGIVVTTPLLLVFTRARTPRLQVTPLEAIMQLCLVVAVLWVVFGSGWFEELKLFYILFLPLVWIAMRHGIEGTTIATVVIQIGLIVAMWLGNYGAGIVAEFQFLLLAVAVMGLFLGLTVSERREIALQLRDKQFELDRSLRLTAASEMASALAHELNQPLSAIGNYVRACQVLISGGQQPAPTALKDTMDKVVVEVTRAGNVVRQLRDFFRTGSGSIAPVDVRGLLQSALDTAHPRLERHHVARRLDCAVSLPPVLVDRIQVETVLHNLISNAIDALKLADERREIVLSAALDDPSFVRISVADSGPGIPDKIAAQLFRPFATSKPDGMGLGLAISRSIVEARGGRLWLQVIERGCMFSFTLPTSGATP